MSELLVSPIAEIVLHKLGSIAYQEVSLICGVKKDLLKLENTLTTIKAVLLDAEEQQFHNHEARVWLEKLKDVCYDAEDVLGEFEAEALRRQTMVNSRKVWDPKSLTFRFRIAHKMNDIRERLDEIALDKAKFHLNVNRDVGKQREMTTDSFVLASDVIGRDKDQEEITKLLIQPSDDENVPVVPIVGIGGLGKTALAKLVYDDKKIDEYFDLKIWVCVSDDFVEKKIIINIINSATGKKHSTMDVDQLQKILRDVLSGRRYLLVMDDVWNENARRWIDFKKLLLGGANGSKIIVTTRSSRVASIMGTMRGVNGYKLEGLSYENCLSLFMKYAFKEGEAQHPHLKKIGEEIVKKCGGVPLAVKTLGSLLYSSTDEDEWKYVNDNEIWNLEQKEGDILPALKLSYAQLPPCLKQCFAYCSIFPKDYEFSHIHLIQVWMAHGLLQSCNENEEMEDIGMRYLKELVSRSFFQDFEQKLGYFYIFKMHDLMHDLALSVSKNECLIVSSPKQVISRKVRHLSFVDANTIRGGLPNFLVNLDHLRTILFPFYEERPTQSFAKSCISKFSFLRMLDLRNSDIEALPKSIGNLKQLRYLDLAYNLKMKNLPNSICKLQILQTLIIIRCDELEQLPREIGRLISLRMLTLTTTQKRLPENGIGCLKSLRYLRIQACDNLVSLFEDINRLKALRTLIIGNCPSLLSLPHGMTQMRSLENLMLVGCEKLSLYLQMETEGNVNHQDLNSARPHLRALYMRKLPNLVEFPQWLLQCSSNTLHWLGVVNCPNFMALPMSLQNLESLQFLGTANCPKLSSLPEDMHRLTALRNLHIKQCGELNVRCKPGTGEDWPKIANVPNIKLDGELIKSSY